MQHVRNQFAQPINYLDLNNMVKTLRHKSYPNEIKNEKEIDDEFDYSFFFKIQLLNIRSVYMKYIKIYLF